MTRLPDTPPTPFGASTGPAVPLGCHNGTGDATTGSSAASAKHHPCLEKPCTQAETSVPSVAHKPSLTIELIELAICFSLRLLPGKFYLPGDAAIAHPLNVLSRSAIPTPTKIALMHLPTVSLASAALCDGDVAQLLNMMVYLSAAPYHRPITCNTSAFLGRVARHGALPVLQWWQEHKDTLPLVMEVDGVVDQALRFDQMHVLDWCMQQGGFPLPTDSLFLIWDRARPATLSWCMAHGLALEYTEQAMDSASACGNVDVLTWWKESGLLLKYSHISLLRAIGNKCHKVLDWWADSGLKLYGDELVLTSMAIEAADMYGLEWLARNNMLIVHSTLLKDLFAIDDIKVIKWCMDRSRMQPSALSVNVASDAWIGASKRASPEALELALTLGFQVPSEGSEYLTSCLVGAAELGRIANLDWWLWQIPTLTVHHFTRVTTAATKSGHVAVLNWLQQHGYYDQENGPDISALTEAARRGYLDVIDWFAQRPRCGCGTRSHHEFPHTVFLAAVESGHEAIVKWWCKNTMSVPSFTVSPTAARPAFLTAARLGYFTVLKTWVDRRVQVSPDLTDLPSHLVKEVLFALMRQSMPAFKWWMSLLGCRSHAWCAELVKAASTENKVEVLDWLFDLQLLDPDHEYEGLEQASARGHVPVLDWWAAHSDSVKSSYFPIDCIGDDELAAATACHWWAHNTSSLSLRACELPLAFVTGLEHVALADRMIRLGLFSLPTSYSVYDEASASGRVDVLTWWYSTDLVTNKGKTYSKEALLEASIHGQVGALEWWRLMSLPGPCTSGSGPLKFKCPFRSLDGMMDEDNIDPVAVEWWIKSGLLPETAPEGDQGNNDESDGDDGDENEDDDDGGDDNDDMDDDDDGNDNGEDPMAVDEGGEI